MKINNILSAIILASVFTSCENEIPFDIKENNPKLIVNAIIETNSKDNYILLAKTGRLEVDPVSEATINIYINGELRELLTEPSPPDTIYYESGYYIPNTYNSKNTRYKTELHYNPGDKVKIEVFAENNKYHAWAEDVIPKPIEIEHIDTMTFIKDNYPFIRLKTTFIDKPNEKNFYRIALTRNITYFTKTIEGNIIKNGPFTDVVYIDPREDFILNGGKVITDTELISAEENNYSIFDDSNLNGAYSMTTSFNRPIRENYYYYADEDGSFTESISFEYKVYLINITEMQYYYLRALNIIASSSYDEYLSTPVSFPSNVEGGVGFVGFGASSCKSFSIPDIIPISTSGEYGGDYYPY